MLSYFEYGGKKSSNMGLKISKDTIYTSPERDIEFIEVVGKDGDIAFDKKRFKPFTYPIHTIYQPELNNIDLDAYNISQWLKYDIRYKSLFLSWDPNYIYSAIFYEQFAIETTLPKFGKIPLNFKCQPQKFRKDGQSKLTVAQSQILINPENRNAKPLIKITGSGTITLKNNGADWLILTSVDGYITIDSAQMSIHKDGLQQFQKMNANLKPLFPILTPGNNVITWTGTITTLEITPRWEAII